MKKTGLVLLALLSFNLTGCQMPNLGKETTATTAARTEHTTEYRDSEKETSTEYDEELEYDEDVAEEKYIEVEVTTEATYDIPSYSYDAYYEINGNVPNFSDSDKTRTDAFETYSDLDALGRCGVAYANICEELEPTEPRGEIGQIKPSGWHTVKYNDLIDGNYLYNRCHLIGYQLAGENANEKNLITGTRYLNVQGMLPFEDMVDDYVDSTGNHVLYRVTPVFDGNNLVASGVQMEAWSVEDGGAGICFNIYCYNIQPGIEIDYATGDSYISETTVSTTEAVTVAPTAAPTETPTTTTSTVVNTEAAVTGQTQDFIVNTNTKKFHLPGCSSVSQMAEKNKMSYTGTKEELIEQGYSPCKRCLS